MTLCRSAGKTGPAGGHQADCEVLECGFHCAPPGAVVSHECDNGGNSRTVVAEGRMVYAPVGAPETPEDAEDEE